MNTKATTMERLFGRENTKCWAATSKELSQCATKNSITTEKLPDGRQVP